MCGKATEKVDPEASLKSGCGGPLFGGSRPLTAQKGVQHQENERYVLWGAGPAINNDGVAVVCLYP